MAVGCAGDTHNPTPSDALVEPAPAAVAFDMTALHSASCPDGVPFTLPKTLDLSATPLALNEDQPTQTEFDQLTYVGGFVLESTEEAFGGLSGMDFLDSDTLLLVSDQGFFVWMDLDLSGSDEVSFQDQAFIAEMRDSDGELAGGSKAFDAEGVTFNGELAFVSFERDHRVLAYDLEACGASARGAMVVGFNAEDIDIGNSIQSNGGMEALAQLDENTLLVGIETPAPDGLPFGPYVFGTELPDVSRRMGVFDGKVLTGMDVSGDDLYSVHRSYKPLQGNRIAIVHTAMGTGETTLLGTLKPPLSVDNFEAIAVTQGPNGDRIVIVADNNYSDRQRSLLMVFDLK